MLSSRDEDVLCMFFQLLFAALRLQDQFCQRGQSLCAALAEGSR